MFELLGRRLPTLFFKDEPGLQVSMKRLSLERQDHYQCRRECIGSQCREISSGTSQIVSPQPQIQMYPAGVDRHRTYAIVIPVAVQKRPRPLPAK